MKKGKLFYISILALVAILFSVAYFSYAFFLNEHEYNGKLNIVAGTLNYRLESDSLDNNNQLTIPAQTELKIDLDIVSLNNIDSKYVLYYTTSDNTDLDIKYSTYKDSAISNIDKNKKNTVIIKATNTGASDKTITFKTIGGFKNSNITRSEGYSIEELAPITLTLNYNDGVTSNSTRQVLYGQEYNIPTTTRAGYIFKGWNGKNLSTNNWRQGDWNSTTTATRVSTDDKIFISSGTSVAISYDNKNYQWSTALLDTATANSYTRVISWENTVSLGDYVYVAPSDTYMAFVWRKISETNIFPNEIDSIKFQVEIGNITTPYEPYYIETSTPVTQSTNHTLTAEWEPNTYEVTLDYNDGVTANENMNVIYGEEYGSLPEPTRTGYTFKGWHGKNIFDGNLEYGDIVNDTGLIPETGSSSLIRSNDYIQVKSNTNYVISNNMNYANYIYEYDNEKNFIRLINNGTDSNNPYSFSTTSTTSYIKIRTRSTERQNDLSTLFQIEEGFTATPYEPYFVSSTTLVTTPKNHILTAIWEEE